MKKSDLSELCSNGVHDTTMVHSTRTNPLDFPLSTPEQIHSSRHPSIQPRQYYMPPFTSPKLHKTHRDIDRLHQTPSNTPENISSVSPQFGHKPKVRFLFQVTPLSYQNTKTSLCGHSENHWVMLFFTLFSSVREKLQFTVFLDHPVLVIPWLSL